MSVVGLAQHNVRFEKGWVKKMKCWGDQRERDGFRAGDLRLDKPIEGIL
jgi:hypothetical protein